LTGISKVHSLCLPSVSYSVVKERSATSYVAIDAEYQ